MAKQSDLTYGEDIRGDYAFFIHIKHFQESGWKLDKEAKDAVRNEGTIFFRAINDKGEMGFHGWLENGKVIQHG